MQLSYRATLLSHFISFSRFSFSCAEENKTVPGKWSALFCLAAFLGKPFGLFVFPVLAVFYVLLEATPFRRTTLSKYLPFIQYLALFFGLTFAVFWYLTGNPFEMIFNFYSKEPMHLLSLDTHQLLIYPRQMFLPHVNGELLHGVHFWGLLLALLTIPFFRANERAQFFLPIAWFFALFFCVNFLPHGFKDGEPQTAVRLFRYFVITIPPSVVCLALFFNSLQSRLPQWGAKGIFTTYFLLSFWGSYQATLPARESFSSVRRILHSLATLEPDVVRAEYYLTSKLERFFSAKPAQFPIRPLPEQPSSVAWASVLRKLKPGYVITGGPPRPYGKCPACTVDTSALTIPSSWTLILEEAARSKVYGEHQPLQVWHIAAPHDDEVLFPARESSTPLQRCLREQVEPLREIDGLGPNEPITGRRARQVRSIVCENYAIRDLTHLDKFTELRILHVVNGGLTKVDFATLSNLESVVIFSNKIREVTGLQSLTNVHTFWAAQNELEQIDLAGMSALRDLRLDNNDLKTIENLPKELSVLHLEGNPDLDIEVKSELRTW